MASTELSISAPRQTSRDPYFSLMTPIPCADGIKAWITAGSATLFKSTRGWASIATVRQALRYNISFKWKNHWLSILLAVDLAPFKSTAIRQIRIRNNPQGSASDLLPYKSALTYFIKLTHSVCVQQTFIFTNFFFTWINLSLSLIDRKSVRKCKFGSGSISKWLYPQR